MIVLYFFVQSNNRSSLDKLLFHYIINWYAILGNYFKISDSDMIFERFPVLILFSLGCDECVAAWGSWARSNRGCQIRKRFDFSFYALKLNNYTTGWFIGKFYSVTKPKLYYENAKIQKAPPDCKHELYKTSESSIDRL